MRGQPGQQDHASRGLGEIVTSGESDFREVEFDPSKNYFFDAIGAIDGWDLAKEDIYEGDITLGNADILGVGREPARLWEVPAQLLDFPRLRVWEKRRPEDFCKYPRQIPDRSCFRRRGTGTGTYHFKARVNNFCIIVNGEPLDHC